MCEHTFVRWDELTVENEEGRRLPGYRDAATVRTFDAPEALDVRFYEVHARSVLNRVPKASRMPFRWTINPYRGCTHACQFCLRGDTPILMENGRTKPMAEVRAWGLHLWDGSRMGATGAMWSLPSSITGRHASTRTESAWRTAQSSTRAGITAFSAIEAGNT